MAKIESSRSIEKGLKVSYKIRMYDSSWNGAGIKKNEWQKLNKVGL